jgi:hypothetical protein
MIHPTTTTPSSCQRSAPVLPRAQLDRAPPLDKLPPSPSHAGRAGGVLGHGIRHADHNAVVVASDPRQCRPVRSSTAPRPSTSCRHHRAIQAELVASPSPPSPLDLQFQTFTCANGLELFKGVHALSVPQSVENKCLPSFSYRAFRPTPLKTILDGKNKITVEEKLIARKRCARSTPKESIRRSISP